MRKSSPNLYSLIKEIANQQKESIAIHLMETKIHYNRLFTMVDHFATELSQFGLQAGDYISLHMPNSVEFIVALLASAKLEVIPMLVNPSLPKSQACLIIRSHQAHHLDSFSVPMFLLGFP